MTRIRALIDLYAIRLTLPPGRDPLVIWLFTILAISVTPTAIGALPLPGSLDRFPAITGHLSAAALVIGCILGTFGLLHRNRDRGLPWEICAAILGGFGSLVYALALWQTATPANRAFAFGATAGLGVGWLWKACQIGLYVRGRKLRPSGEVQPPPEGSQ